MIKGMIFDLDGVIVTTDEHHYKAWKELADELSIPFTKTDNERLKGVSRMASLDIILSLGTKTYSDEEKMTFAKLKNDRYVASIDKMTSSAILPGVEAFLISAREAGIKISLGSASKNAMRILNRLNLTQYFDAIIDGNHVTHAKPDPEVFLKGAKALGLSSKECVVFEDAKAGIEAAKAGGMIAVAIGTKDALPNADYYFTGLGDIEFETFYNTL